MSSNTRVRRTASERRELVEKVKAKAHELNTSPLQACKILGIKSASYYEWERLQRLGLKRGLQSPGGEHDDKSGKREHYHDDNDE